MSLILLIPLTLHVLRLFPNCPSLDIKKILQLPIGFGEIGMLEADTVNKGEAKGGEDNNLHGCNLK